jgi:hypothetical protein
VRALVLLVLVATACGDDAAPPTRTLVSAQPSYAPLTGGTLIELAGAGFAPGDRVLVDGREASFVDVVDATRIQVIVPPGEAPGDVEVVVFGASGTASARGVLHYSTAPDVTAVSPADVAVTKADSVVTVHGSGFVDEGAGEAIVLVDGQRIEAVTIIDDGTLSFVAPGGRPFSRARVEVINARGRAARERAFRYTPSDRPGLLLFPRYGTFFARFYNPVDGTSVPIPAITNTRFTSVVREADGTYWGVDTSNRFGPIDLETQDFAWWGNTFTRLPAVARHAGQLYGLVRYLGNGGRFGAVDAQTGEFVPIGTIGLFCCGSYGIASDGTTLWLTSRQDWSTYQLRTVDPSTGEMGTPVVLQGGATYRVEELRWWNGSLFAATSNGKIVTIDPATGGITEVLTVSERISAIAEYE